MENQRANEEAANRCAENSKRLTHSLRAQGVARRHDLDHVDELIKRVKEKAEVGTQKVHFECYDVEVDLTHKSTDSIAEAGGCLAEHAALAEKAAKHTEHIRDEISTLYRSIDEERKERIEKSRELAQGVRSKLREVREALAAERRLREQSRDTLVELFGQMGERMNTLLQDTRKCRITSYERIFNVVEAVLVPKASGRK
jgi:hypothetical protein